MAILNVESTFSDDNKKYEFTGVKLILPNGKTLYEIRSLRDFGNIHKGDIGGFIEGEHNLSHMGDCWVKGHAMIFDYAFVCGNAIIGENAKIFGDAIIRDNAKIEGNAKIYGKTIVSDNVWIFGNAEFGFEKMIEIKGNRSIGCTEIFPIPVQKL